MTPAEIPDELVAIVNARAGREHSREGSVLSCLADLLTRWEEIRPQVCPFDCDGCHDDDACPCDRLGCAGYVDEDENEDEDDNLGGSCAAGVPCPPFEDVTLEVLPGEPEPGAFARAAFGDEWTERTAAGYARRRRDVTSVTKMWFGEKHGWLTYEEAVAAGFEDRVTPLEHRGGAVTGFVEPGTFD